MLSLHTFLRHYHMKEQRILAQDTNGNYQKGELCRT